MAHELEFFIDGRWIPAGSSARIAVIDPSTGEEIATIADGDAGDVDRAVLAARRAFDTYRSSTVEERMGLLRGIRDGISRRREELALVITREMGSPIKHSRGFQIEACLIQIDVLLKVLEQHKPVGHEGRALVRKEPIGVCGLITPWNGPAQQIVNKAVTCLAAGCTMVVKPSEVTPLSAIILAEILDEAGVPPGVFNLVQGGGASVGAALAAHPGVDMISFTGSKRAATAITIAAADTVKRVVTELGGKSANLVLDDAPLETAIPGAVISCFINSGQMCIAPSRLLVPEARRDEAVAIARATADRLKLGPPMDPAVDIGPMANAAQFAKVSSYVERGLSEGATLVCGGVGRPAGLDRGFYSQPTIFADVTPNMTIAREEIFGPVLAIISYSDETEMLRIANDSRYGLAGYVQSADPKRALEVATRLEAGSIQINYVPFEPEAPFGGYKQSGNGREWGRYGFEEFLETKSIVGWGAASGAEDGGGISLVDAV